MNKPAQYCILAILAVCGALLMTGCGHESVADAKTNDEPVKIEEAPDINLVTMQHPELFQLASVDLRKVRNELQVNGVVSPDVSRNVPVNALVSGRALDLRIQLGDNVQKGQVLLTLTSPDISSAISDYKKAMADEALARTQLDRAKLLYEKGAYAQKDLEVAQDTEDKAAVDTQTAADRIRILGGDVKNPSPVIEVRAPMAGTIVEQNVTNAAGVKTPDNSPNLFVIADLSHVWVLCDVYENDLAKVHLGDRAIVQLNAYPGKKLEGRVSNIGSVLDPTTRSAKVRIDLPNPNRTLRPNMFATVEFISLGTESRMTVPVSAILRLQDRDWVFLKLTRNQFRKTDVEALPAEAGYQEILTGVRPGDQVAADALQFSRAIENQEEQSHE